MIHHPPPYLSLQTPIVTTTITTTNRMCGGCVQVMRLGRGRGHSDGADAPAGRTRKGAAAPPLRRPQLRCQAARSISNWGKAPFPWPHAKNLHATPTPTTEWEPVHPSNTRFCTPSSRLRRTIADVRIRFAGTIFPHIERLLHLYGICTCAYISLESTRSRAPVGTRRESPWMWARRVVA